MIKIKKNVDKFITLFKIIGKLTPETNITFNKTEMIIKAIHQSNTCIITLSINKNMFEEYEVEKDVTYLVDIEKFTTIMEIVSEKELCIDITDKGLIIKQGRKKFVLNHFTKDDDDRPRPITKADSKWKIDTNNFFNIINDLTKFSESCTLEANDNLTIFSKSSLVEGDIVIEAEKIESIDSVGNYDIGNMVKISDIKQIFPSIRIGFSSDDPFVMRATDDNIDFEFILAGMVKE